MTTTIAAISTSPIGSAINIIRISGACATEVADAVFSSKGLKSFSVAEHAKMYLGQLKGDGYREKCFAVCFFAPISYTGENLVEIQCHGGYYAAESVLKLCIKAGAVPAERGEFTRRAFVNGKLSLSDAEAVADMINAESSAALSAAANLADGALSKEVSALTQTVKDSLAQLEASLDYPEEMEDEAEHDTRNVLTTLAQKLSGLAESFNRGRVLKHGIRVALVGLPNIGKSSILNRVLKKDRAIVTDIPGTTTDVIEDKTEINGVAVWFLDTAGIREGGHEIEKIGIQKSLNAAHAADIVVFVTECGRGFLPEEQQIFDGIRKKDSLKPVIIAKNKSDLCKSPEKLNKNEVLVSAKDGSGVDTLLQLVFDNACKSQTDTASITITNQRHHAALLRAKKATENALLGLENNIGIELVIEDVREIYFALGEISGDTATENVIDTIFEKFCLGK